MTKPIRNELHRELLSSSALNPWYAHTSSPRGAMFTGNLGQFLAVLGATKRRQLTGVEREFAKTTFSLGFDRDVEIIKVIRRYPVIDGVADALKYNPQTIIVFEDYATKEVGMLNLVKYHSTHQHFGFRYKENEDLLDQVQPGANFPKGTILANSPLVDEDGDYHYGLETNVAFMSDVSVIEDGIKVSDAYLRRIMPTSYETRIINFGQTRFPINLYGNPGHFQPFPDIGKQIHPDGLLSALREHDDLLNVVNMTPEALCDCDYIYDLKQYAEPNATIVDIKVSRNATIAIPPVPVGMEDQLMKYWNADTVFYRKILDCYLELETLRRDKLKLSPDFHRLVVEAIHRVGPEYAAKGKWGKNRFEAFKVDEVYRNVPLDAWRVEITYERNNIPNVGFKITDTHGGKGVICRVVPEADMPIDKNGNRVEVIMDDLSTTRRLNPGRFYEQYVNAASRDVVLRMRQAFGLRFDYPDQPLNGDDVFDAIHNASDELINEQVDYLIGYYEIIAPRMLKVLKGDGYRERGGNHEIHLWHVLKDGIYLFLPPSNPINRPDAIRQIEKRYPPFRTPVTFRGLDGRMVTTVSDVLIGSMYFMVLEKTGEDWSAVSSAKLQHYGTTARLTNHDKYSAPGRLQVTKTIGESESSLLAAAVGGDVTADIMDSTNNPRAHKYMQRMILTHPTPTNIDKVLDREEIPKGGHRPLGYLKHNFQCSGKEFSNE